MTFDEQEEAELLALARAWKDGHIGRVHPSVGRLFNLCLFKAGEDAVPFAGATSPSRPSVAQIIIEAHPVLDMLATR